jgi:hypothetical protein
VKEEDGKCQKEREERGESIDSLLKTQAAHSQWLMSDRIATFPSLHHHISIRKIVMAPTQQIPPRRNQEEAILTFLVSSSCFYYI